MARTKSTSSIETEITKITAELTKLQKKQETLTDRLLELQKQKQEYEFKQVMEAFQKKWKKFARMMIFLEV